MQTVYDTVVFALISYKAMKVTRRSRGQGHNGVQLLVAQQGVMYYAWASFFPIIPYPEAYPE